MNRLGIICLLLLATAAGLAAETYSLTYEGYPYKKTHCEDPSYAEGARLTLSSGQPKKEDKVFQYWTFDGQNYAPGQTFTMPAKDVVLVAVWGDGEGMESVQPSACSVQKVLRNGQLLIVRGDEIYTVTGVRIEN